MSFAKADPGARGAAVALRGRPAADRSPACDTLSSLNPFDKSEKYKTEIVPEVPAEQLYNDGLARIQKSDYEGAAKKFGELEKQYPYSEWSRKALIMTAYANYEGGHTRTPSRRRSAICSSIRPRRTRPTPSTSWRCRTTTRSRTSRATRRRPSGRSLALQELVDRYPKSEYVSDARRRSRSPRDQLAGKEMEVGRFYLQKRNYTGAINRFRERGRQVPDDPPRRGGAQRLTEAYMAMGIVNEAQTAAAVLGHNFPDSPWYKDAYAPAPRAASSRGGHRVLDQQGASAACRGSSQKTG